MRIKIDENLAAAHKRILENAGHNVTDVHEENLGGASDADLWSQVCMEGRFLVTLDLDFSDVRKFPPGTHAGILLVRTTHPSRDAVGSILRRVVNEVDLQVLEGCLAVADETRTRVRRSRQD